MVAQMSMASPIPDPLRIFVGYDAREHDAYLVCRQSLLDYCNVPLMIEPLNHRMLRHAGLYHREWMLSDGQFVDVADNRPFSTEFAFSRFLVAALCQWRGTALFCDCDFLWQANVKDLFDAFDPSFAVQVVQHDHVPDETVKMEGQVQTKYYRKNWSSLVLWNCDHPANLMLTPDRVNQERGQWLHAFDWLRPDQIGALDPLWNWLNDPVWNDKPVDPWPKAIHFTSGGPWHKGHENVGFAGAWREVLERVKQQ